MYERLLVNVKVERGSTLTCTRDLPYNVSVLFTRVKCTCVRTEKLHDCGNLALLFVSLRGTTVLGDYYGIWCLTALVRAFLVNIDRRLRDDWGRVR